MYLRPLEVQVEVIRRYFYATIEVGNCLGQFVSQNGLTHLFLVGLHKIVLRKLLVAIEKIGEFIKKFFT